MFFRQLAAAVSAGLPVISALDMFTSHQVSNPIRKFALQLQETISSGAAFSEAFENRRKLFVSGIPAIISAGEKTGGLDEALIMAAEICEMNYSIHVAISKTMVYPAFILLFGIFILPLHLVFSSGFAAYASSLRYPIGMGLLLVLVYFLLKQFIRYSDTFRLIVDRIALRTPVIGKIIRNFSIARFAKILRSALRSGLDFIASVRLAGAGSGNRFIMQRIYDIIPEFSRGTGLSSGLAETGIFPPVFLSFVSAGEQSGNLEEMLDRAERMHSEQAFTTLQRALTLLGPIVFILVAIYLAVQIISFWRAYYGTLDHIIRPGQLLR